ncbi:hypothetical protein EYF80_038013 [Liparis tanakae]|uniref:Uncharacterized protein n=1 Tax=Liparis tanakae TaxID=230148 RepID=A0A4Z2GF32_9TELE|nr:hypothetical protein EYF80_038013 [Liparis tanakae]
MDRSSGEKPLSQSEETLMRDGVRVMLWTVMMDTSGLQLDLPDYIFGVFRKSLLRQSNESWHKSGVNPAHEMLLRRDFSHELTLKRSGVKLKR